MINERLYVNMSMNDFCLSTMQSYDDYFAFFKFFKNINCSLSADNEQNE